METLYAAGRVAYDGTNYHGFQYQVGVPTVQGTLEEALRRFCEPASRVVGAGRTDAGVHANGQVIAVEVAWRHGADALQQAWNAHLPPDICVRRMQPAPKSFHPRFSARWRTYRYRLVEGPPHEYVGKVERSPLTDRYAWYVPERLDVAAMQMAAKALLGEHDFATFGQPTQGESTVRTVSESWFEEDDSGVALFDSYPGQGMVFTITANGFLRKMVRTLTGTLVEIGLGTRAEDDMVRLLAVKDRSQSAPPAPACGLTLEQVVYAEEDGITI